MVAVDVLARKPEQLLVVGPFQVVAAWAFDRTHFSSFEVEEPVSPTPERLFLVGAIVLFAAMSGDTRSWTDQRFDGPLLDRITGVKRGFESRRSRSRCDPRLDPAAAAHVGRGDVLEQLS